MLLAGTLLASVVLNPLHAADRHAVLFPLRREESNASVLEISLETAEHRAMLRLDTREDGAESVTVRVGPRRTLTFSASLSTDSDKRVVHLHASERAGHSASGMGAFSYILVLEDGAWVDRSIPFVVSRDGNEYHGNININDL